MNGTAISPPASAGPMIPVDVKAVVFSATAFISFSSPTSTGIQACLAGTLNAKTVPVISAITNTCQTVTRSVWIRTAKPTDVMAIVVWLKTVSRALWMRS